MPQADAFQQLYERHASLVYSIALSYLRVPADAEDVTADVFVQILEDEITFSDDDHARAWLITAVRNRCKNLLKSWRRSRRTDPEKVTAQTSDEDKRALSEALDAIAALPERYRLPLLLTAVEGYSTAETAQLLHCNESTVRTRISRARAIVRKKLGD